MLCASGCGRVCAPVGSERFGLWIPSRGRSEIGPNGVLAGTSASHGHTSTGPLETADRLQFSLGAVWGVLGRADAGIELVVAGPAFPVSPRAESAPSGFHRTTDFRQRLLRATRIRSREAHDDVMIEIFRAERVLGRPRAGDRRAGRDLLAATTEPLVCEGRVRVPDTSRGGHGLSDSFGTNHVGRGRVRRRSHLGRRGSDDACACARGGRCPASVLRSDDD